jgi:hypothetical protein
MKTVLAILGILLMLMGCVWCLQGINVLPGSFMTGQLQWAVYGVFAVIAGGILLAYSRRMGRKP